MTKSHKGHRKVLLVRLKKYSANCKTINPTPICKIQKTAIQAQGASIPTSGAKAMTKAHSATPAPLR